MYDVSSDGSLIFLMANFDSCLLVRFASVSCNEMRCYLCILCSKASFDVFEDIKSIYSYLFLQSSFC